ncbi:TonB-dependent siderophore receptor [Massilia sp. YMA4]|uniref:TonB-dependent siderophore receptor n=1 Tax=Massilia sp. YMA4 TaxID=1593482 RepID=UPI0018782919|nr:TonB-dependent siderophore receptor [Massilia sp. YMA4]
MALACAALACAALSWLPALAQDVPIATVQVSGARSTPPDANRLGLGVLETPQAITAITADMMRAQGVDSLEDILLNVPGITQAGGHAGIFSNFSARGFQLENASNYFRDGLRFDRQSQISLQNIEQVEVIRGPASLQYGKLVPGGLVNFVTKKPRAVSRYEASVYVNRFGQAEAGFDATGKLDSAGKALYRLNLEARKIDSFRDSVDGESYFLAPAFTFALSDATMLDVMFEHYRHDTLRDPGQPAPDSRDPGSVTRIDPAAFFGEPDATNEVRNSSGALRLNHRVNEQWQLRADYSGSRFERDMHFTVNLNRRPAAPLRVPRVARAGFTDARSDSVRLELFGDFATGEVRHKLLAGVDRLERRVDDLTTANTMLAPVDLFHPRPTGNASYSSEPLFDERVRASDTGIYLQDQISMGAWNVMMGVRHDRLRENYHERMLDLRSRHDAGATSPSAGFTYRVAPRLSLYASYSRSLDSNMATNGCGRSYGASRGSQVEAGAKGRAWGGLQWALSAFSLTRSNGLSEDPSGAVDADDNSCLVQGAKQRSTGVELETSGRINRQVRLLAAFTQMNARVSADANPAMAGKKLRNAPRRSARMWLEYDLDAAAPGLRASLGVTHVGERFANDSNSLRLPAYTAWDAGLRYALGGDGSLQMTVSNASNRRYVEDSLPNANSVNQAAPRNVSLRYTHQF